MEYFQVLIFRDFRDGIYLYFSIILSLNCWTKFELIHLILIVGVRGCVLKKNDGECELFFVFVLLVCCLDDEIIVELIFDTY